jgi:anti-sigma regulatory factor (Ser/Thr protein kinase)
MTAGSPLTLIVPSDMGLLPVVRQFVESVCRFGALDQESIDAIVLATNEATSNVIRHGYQCESHHEVHVQCRLLADGIEVVIADTGAPFDVSNVPHLDPSEHRPGGRGVFLMRAVLDELDCCARGDGRNALRMVRRRRPPALGR